MKKRQFPPWPKPNKMTANIFQSSSVGDFYIGKDTLDKIPFFGSQKTVACPAIIKKIIACHVKDIPITLYDYTGEGIWTIITSNQACDKNKRKENE